MKLDLQLNNSKDNVLSSNLYDNSLKNSLENALNNANSVLNYKHDERIFTAENENQIWDKSNDLLFYYASKNNLDNCENGKLYLVKNIDNENSIAYLTEYNSLTNEKQNIKTNLDCIPNNTRENSLLRKYSDKYVIDEKSIKEINTSMNLFKDELYSQQEKHLNAMRKEGNIYKINSKEDDCMSKYTELINTTTNEKFQEINFPHNLYHNVGEYVKYENGQYSIVQGTDKYVKSPYKYDFCELESCYNTRFGKIDERTWSMWNYKLEKMFNKASNSNNIANIFTDIRINSQIFFNRAINNLSRIFK